MAQVTAFDFQDLLVDYRQANLNTHVFKYACPSHYIIALRPVLVGLLLQTNIFLVGFKSRKPNVKEPVSGEPACYIIHGRR